MKLEDDFNAMFMIVDTSNKGYLTVEEVTDFYHTLFCNEVAIDLVGLHLIFLFMTVLCFF